MQVNVLVQFKCIFQMCNVFTLNTYLSHEIFSPDLITIFDISWSVYNHFKEAPRNDGSYFSFTP